MTTSPRALCLPARAGRGWAVAWCSGPRALKLPYGGRLRSVAAGAAVLALMHGSEAPTLQAPDVNTTGVVIQQTERLSLEPPKTHDVVDAEISEGDPPQNCKKSPEGG